MTKPLPTIILVPGAWHSPSCFDLLQPLLQAQGYPTESIAHPSVGAEPPTKTLADDATNLRKRLISLIDDQGKSVVLVGHSYGGMIVSNASEGLGELERARAGRKGGIALVVYLTAFVITEGGTLAGALGGVWPEWGVFDGEYSSVSDPASIFYHDVQPELQRVAIADLRHGSRASYYSAITHEPWRRIPCGYIYCDKDRAVPLVMQEMFVAVMRDDTVEAGPERQVKLPPVLTAHLSASHSPFLSMPGKTAGVLVEMIAQSERNMKGWRVKSERKEELSKL